MKKHKNKTAYYSELQPRNMQLKIKGYISKTLMYIYHVYFSMIEEKNQVFGGN